MLVVLLVLLVLLSCRYPAETPTGSDSPAPPEDDTGTSKPDDTGPCNFDELNLLETLEHVFDATATWCEKVHYIRMLDERSKIQGPWFEDMFVVHSDDGVTFNIDEAVPLFTQAAVPDVMLGDDGRYYLFYGQGDIEVGKTAASIGSDYFQTHGLIGYGALQLAISEDGYNFTESEDFGIDNLVRGMVIDPDVIRLPDGSYRLYYAGIPIPELADGSTWEDDAEHNVYYATSTDLVHWEQEGLAVVGPRADPSTHCVDGSICVMTSTGIDWSTSFDGGRTFEFERRQWPPGFAPEFHALEGGAVRMFYNSKTGGGPLHSRLSAGPGEPWLEEGERVEKCLVEAVSLADAPDGGFLMYYHYWQDGYSGDTWGDASDTGEPNCE